MYTKFSCTLKKMIDEKILYVFHHLMIQVLSKGSIETQGMIYMRSLFLCPAFAERVSCTCMIIAGVC